LPLWLRCSSVTDPWRIFFLLTPCRGTKSLATHPFPIYEVGSKENTRDKMNSSRALFRVNPVYLS
jgi:hypothetical protein